MLCDSHLAPAGLYRYCQARELGPVRMTPNEIAVANEEVTAYLLCEECEQQLNRDGENWLLPKLATIEKTFPFYDLLVTGPPDTVENGVAAYACSRNQKIGFRKLTNFAVGVFWKASVHSWRKGKPGPLIELGKYREPLRLFLLREGGFPEYASLTIGIMPPEKAVIGFNMPQLRGTRPYHQYLFYVPGMIFILSVGRQVTGQQKEICFFSNPLHPIILADLSQDIYKLLGRNIKNAVKSTEVREFMDARRRQIGPET